MLNFLVLPGTRISPAQYISEKNTEVKFSNVASLSSLISFRPFIGKHSVLLHYYRYPLCARCQLGRLEMAKAVLRYLNTKTKSFGRLFFLQKHIEHYVNLYR